jgi:hypothetical protein
MDVLFNKHIYPLVLRTWRRNGVTQENLDTEIDARYSLVPPWTVGMRRFKEGIMAQTHHWSCHEFKYKMRQIIGCFLDFVHQKASRFSESICIYIVYLIMQFTPRNRLAGWKMQ